MLCAEEDALTIDLAKEMLGWTEESENVKFEDEYLLRDLRGKKIRCLNNPRNRPLYAQQWTMLMQEILRGNYVLNGETIIIGKTGLVLNGQHTLIALILAGQMYEDKPGQYTKWTNGPPTLDKVVVQGIAEDDRTVNTMDTCKPRSLSDVIYRSEYFADLKKGPRQKVSKAVENAVKLVWHRTGAKDNAFAPIRTHAESLRFIERHKRILECVKHCYEEEGKKNRITWFIGVGYASGLMYLMAASLTEALRDDKKGYHDLAELSKDPDESCINFDQWNKAEEFWVLLAAGDKTFAALREIFGPDHQTGSYSVQEKCSLIINAFNIWIEGEKVTTKEIKLEYKQTEEGNAVQINAPILGGIDIGKPTGG